MNKYKNILLSGAYFLLSLIIYLLIITTLAYFNVISYKTISIISFIYIISIFMINGFLIGMKSDKKGYLSGLITGTFNIILILILALVFRSFPNIKSLIYFLILLLSSTFGGMLGINYKK